MLNDTWSPYHIGLTCDGEVRIATKEGQIEAHPGEVLYGFLLHHGVVGIYGRVPLVRADVLPVILRLKKERKKLNTVNNQFCAFLIIRRLDGCGRF